MSVLRRQREGLQALVHLQKACVDDTSPSCLAALEQADWLLGTFNHAVEQHLKRGQEVLAALTAYRGIELVAQHLLARHGILSAQAEVSNDLLSQFSDVRDRVLEKKDDIRPFQSGQALGLLESYVLLWVLKDEIVRSVFPKQKDLKNLLGISEGRNKALLVHGFLPPKTSSLEGLQRYLSRLLQQLGTTASAYPVHPVPIG